ncbi:MAG: hypothetical protein LBF71_02635 [Campylobacteraceae bacterium]|jgi:hypothetical protein|nr:hypothetical protein [Campylobacteraceae bacterium]
MRLDAALEHIKLRCAQSYALPSDEMITALLHEALIYVARSCEPTVLIRHDGSEHFGEGVLRLLPNNREIIFPEKPDITKPQKHLMMDEELSFAVINYVCFLLCKEAGYLQICDRDILLYVKNQYSVV